VFLPLFGEYSLLTAQQYILALSWRKNTWNNCLKDLQSCMCFVDLEQLWAQFTCFYSYD